MRNAGLDESQPEIKITRRDINNLRYTDDITLMAEIEEELKRLLMGVKEESEKAGLKLNIQKTKIMASSLITSWQIDRRKVETVTDLIWEGVGASRVPKLLQMVTAAMKFKDACSLEEKLWQRQHIKKQKHHFANKCQSYGFFNNHIWMWYLEQKEGWERNNWCLRNAVLEKTLERPLVSKEITPVNPKEINPEYSLKWLMLKLQYFSHLMPRANSLE